MIKGPPKQMSFFSMVWITNHKRNIAGAQPFFGNRLASNIFFCIRQTMGKTFAKGGFSWDLFRGWIVLGRSLFSENPSGENNSGTLNISQKEKGQRSDRRQAIAQKDIEKERENEEKRRRPTLQQK